MGEHAYIGELAAAIFYLAAGLRLLRVSFRTGLIEGRLLGSAFSAFGIAYLFYVAPDLEPSLVPLMTPLSFLGRVTTAVGMAAIAVFTWQVFQKDAAWAKWLAWGSVCLNLLGIGVSIWEKDWAGFSTLTSVGYWMVWVGETIPLVWVGIEGFVGFRRMSKQVLFGFSEPLVANRFLLWCLFGVMQVAAMIVEIPMNVGFETQGVFTTGPDAVMGALEIATIAIVWLAFFPPIFYRNWINGTPPAADAA